MITFHQAAPTVFVYETSPSYWQDCDSGSMAAADRSTSSSPTSVMMIPGRVSPLGDNGSTTAKRRTAASNQSGSIPGSATSRATASSQRAFSNFGVTDHSKTGLSLSMQVAPNASDLKVQLEVEGSAVDGGESVCTAGSAASSTTTTTNYSSSRLRIRCTYQGQPTTVDRVLPTAKNRLFHLAAITATLSKAGMLTINIPKRKQKRPKRRTARRRIPVQTQREPAAQSTTTTTCIKPQVKRLELEIPASIQAKDIQLVLDTKSSSDGKNTLFVSAKRPASSEEPDIQTSLIFQRKFSIDPRRVLVEKFQAVLMPLSRDPATHALLVITAPVRAEKSSVRSRHVSPSPTTTTLCDIPIRPVEPGCHPISPTVSFTDDSTTGSSFTPYHNNNNCASPMVYSLPNNNTIDNHQNPSWFVMEPTTSSATTTWESPSSTTRVRPNQPEAYDKHLITPSALALSQQSSRHDDPYHQNPLFFGGMDCDDGQQQHASSAGQLQLEYKILQAQIMESTKAAAAVVHQKMELPGRMMQDMPHMTMTDMPNMHSMPQNMMRDMTKMNANMNKSMEEAKRYFSLETLV